MHRPVPQELYRHFKGGRYQVITIARDADTGEEQVVYQALYGDYTVYCRPLKEFTSEVDIVKYPNADQRMRFELFAPDETKAAEAQIEATEKKSYADNRPEEKKPVTRAFPWEKDKKEDKTEIKEDKVSASAYKDDDASEGSDSEINSNYMSRTIEEEAEDFGMNPLVVRFLDAGSSAERIEVLNLIRPVVTNDMIDIMAMSIDTEIPGEDPDARCAELRECLMTKQRFEVSRLRS